MPDNDQPERCLECKEEISGEIVSAEEVFANLHTYQQSEYASHGIRIGTAAYCVHCWTFQEPKKQHQREADPEYLRAQWGELNQRSRWYTQQTWQGPFAFITVAAIAGYNLAKTDGLSALMQTVGFFLLTILGIGVSVFLRYVTQGIDSSIRQMMRIELHQKFLRTSALEGAEDPGGFVPLRGIRQHRIIASYIVWTFVTALLAGTISFAWLSITGN
jgi:hypothetical protein